MAAPFHHRTTPGTVTVLCLAACWLAGCGAPMHDAGPVPGEPGQTTELWPGAGGPSRQRTDCGLVVDSGDSASVRDLTVPAEPGGAFTVALTGTVDPGRAPIPSNRSERLVFSHLYETLVRVGCDGGLQPGLAALWACNADSTDWVFTLRPDAVFWDGTRVTAHAVHESWRRSQRRACDGTGSLGLSPWNWLDSRTGSVSVLDARRLVVRLPEPQARFPWLLAHPATAVAALRDGWTWPVGSGPCRLRASDPAPRPELVCRPNIHHPDAPVWKQLVFHAAAGSDPRDLVAFQPDLMVLRDLDHLRFFTDLEGYAAAPLPWDRLYLLLCPPRHDPETGARWRRAAGGLDAERDVTRMTVRPWSHVTYPAGGAADCPQLSGPVTEGNVARLEWNLPERRLDANSLVYVGDDTGARELAGRLGALAGDGQRVVALPPDALSHVVQWQMPGAALVAQPLCFPTACLQTASLLGSAAWLQEAALGRSNPVVAETLGQARLLEPAIADPARVLQQTGVATPLVLSRSWLVVRGDLAGLSLSFDGIPRLTGLGRRATPAP